MACCARFLRDLDRQADPSWPYRFDEALGGRACEFLEHLSHYEGPLAGQRFKMEDWQCFVQAQVWGWVRKSDGARRFSRVELWCPRGQGKSFFVSGNCTYALACTGEGGAQVAAAATTREQARIVLDCSMRQLELSPEVVDELGLEITKHTIFHPETFSRYRALSSEAKTADGKNLYFVSCDELHAHQDRRLYDILLTGLGKRKEGTMFVCSTAGDSVSGIGYERYSIAKKIANGIVDDDRTFVAIWEADEGDPWDDERTWVKANPNLNISVDIHQLRQEAATAKTIASARSSFFTRRLNWWVGSATPFLNGHLWAECMDPEMRREDFLGQECIIGMDLAKRHDFSALAVIFTKEVEGRRHYSVFFDTWVPPAEILESSNASYVGWHADGWIRGPKELDPSDNELDYRVVKDRLKEYSQMFRVRELAYDPGAGGDQLALEVEQETDITPVAIKPWTVHFNLPMKELEAAHASGRLKVEASPVVAWMASNLVSRRNAKDEDFPRKEGDRAENRIDAMTALILGLNRAMATDVAAYQDGEGFRDW